MKTTIYKITKLSKQQAMLDNSNQQNQNESKKSLGNAEELLQNKGNSSPLFERIQVGNSPLVIVGDDEQGWVVALGNYRLTEVVKTRKDAEDELVDPNKMWNTICKLISTILEVQSAAAIEEAKNQLKLDLPGLNDLHPSDIH